MRNRQSSVRTMTRGIRAQLLTLSVISAVSISAAAQEEVPAEGEVAVSIEATAEDASSATPADEANDTAAAEPAMESNESSMDAPAEASAAAEATRRGLL